MTEDEFSDIIDRLLTTGVPATAVAKAFNIDPFVVKERMNSLRVGKYGAAELSEAMANLQWEALDLAKQMMTEAPHAQRTRFIMGMVSKTMSLTARQNPETLGNMRQDLLEFMAMKEDNDELAGTDTTTFIATVEVDEDQDQGSLAHPPGPG